MDALLERLKKAGVRPTSQRAAVARIVLGAADHPTAEDVKRRLEKQGELASLATVYNTLELFVASGLLRAFKLPHTDKVVYDDNTSVHHHVIDEDSGRLYDVPGERVTVKADLPGWRIDDVQVVFKGKRRKK